MSDTALHRLTLRFYRRSLWLGLGALGAAALAAAIYTRSASSSAQAALAPPPPPAVTVSPALVTRTADWAAFTGQFSAVNSVEIRAQVSGYLTEIHFTDGQIVHKGDLLFVIDPRPYQIQLEQAQASLLAAQAQLAFAQKETRRLSVLQSSGAATVESYDQRVQDQAAAQAAVDQAQAAVQSAQLNLQFCHITAPFTGRISAHRMSIGGLVNGGPNAADSTLLTTIVSLDPIYLDFDMSEDDYLAYEHYLHSAQPGGKVDDTVQAELSDENFYPRKGKLNFIDNAIDESSGTMHVRATFANPDLAITPGDFAQLRLPIAAPRKVLLVPDEALQADQSNQVLMTVAPDGTVVSKIVTTGALVEGLREIESGISPSDKIVINGLMRAWPGTKVTPELGSITANAKAD
ncbi:MAG TPA: efflux RND transporter periplasmic adaptor subunit [Acidocella sp.]|jgi:RND family efflux transporter MFP subunit|nr:efflux RND transporter periplasmic adaptor subunit [Acidocella sp.]